MSATRRAGLVLLGLSALIGTASGQTVTVTLGEDVVDIDWQTATIADLPGPDGGVSLSEAIIATDNTPGHQTIAFAIPQEDWLYQNFYPGRAVIWVTNGFFLRSDDPVTIDGTTQTAFTGDTYADGAEVVIFGSEIYVNGDDSTFMGFDSTALSVSGSNAVVRDNTAMNISFFGGSGGLIQDNTGGTIKLDRTNDNVVVGNTVQRVRVLGFGMSQPAANNRIGGPDPADRNYLTGYGTWNSEGLPAGAAVQLVWTLGTVIENNSIGTTPDGLAQGNQACTMGINFQSENEGTTIRNNRIAGILGHGMGPHHAGQLFGWAIYFWGTTADIEIVGNTIGLDANDDPVLGSVWGVAVDNFDNVSDVSIVDCVIAGHILDGIRLVPSADMRISGTAVHSNGWLGIELMGDDFSSGVTPNDLLDADSGANGLQNYPVLTTAAAQGPGLAVAGDLHSSPLDDFTVEFFASSACDPSGFGQAEVFLGSTSVTTDAAGDASFMTVLGAGAPVGWIVTATATLEPLGLTSEFSACLPITDPGAGPGTVVCTGVGCPCGNDDATAGCANSTGVGGLLGSIGSASVSADDLVLVATRLSPGDQGLFYMGDSIVAAPFFDGIQCALGTTFRFLDSIQNTGAVGSMSHSGLVAGSGGLIQAGTTWVFQGWHRDLPGSPCGSGANLTNGLQVAFTP